MKKSIFSKLFIGLLGVSVLLNGVNLYAQDKDVTIHVDNVERSNVNSDRDMYILRLKDKAIASISCYDLGLNSHILRIGKRPFAFKKGPFCKRAIYRIQENADKNKETKITAVQDVGLFGEEVSYVRSVE